MSYKDILVGKFFPNPLETGKTFLAVCVPEIGEIQFDFLNEEGESLHREHWHPKPWGDTMVLDLLQHLPNGNYDVQIKIGNYVMHRHLEIDKPKVKRLKKVQLFLASLLPDWWV